MKLQSLKFSLPDVRHHKALGKTIFIGRLQITSTHSQGSMRHLVFHRVCALSLREIRLSFSSGGILKGKNRKIKLLILQAPSITAMFAINSCGRPCSSPPQSLSWFLCLPHSWWLAVSRWLVPLSPAIISSIELFSGQLPACSCNLSAGY